MTTWRDRLPVRSRWWIAYLAALVGAPLAVAAGFFWVMFIPLLALWFGAIPYLVLAGPGFALALHRFPPNPLIFAAIGLALSLATPLFAIAGLAHLYGQPADWEVIRALWPFAAGMAAIWGAGFALLFRLFHRLLIGPLPRQ